MPDIIPRTLQDAPLLVLWYQWGVIIGCIVALAVSVWTFVDARRVSGGATTWRSLAVTAIVLGIPALLARIDADLADRMRVSLGLVALFSILGLLLALVTLVKYSTAASGSLSVCPVCGHPQRPQWTHCPYHPVPDADTSVAASPPLTVPVTEAVILAATSTPREGSRSPSPLPGEALMDRQALVDPTLVSGNGQSAPALRHETLVLRRENDIVPLAMLVIKSGSSAGTTLSLKDGMTSVGRDGTVNDHGIDDPAVSDRHLSIRQQDGRFTATDLDSSGGTFINGQRIEKQVLTANDVIRIGNTSLEFLRMGDTPPDENMPLDGPSLP